LSEEERKQYLEDVKATRWVRFQVLMAAILKINVFWVGAPCGLIQDDRGAYCLDRQGNILVALRTSHLPSLTVFKLWAACTQNSCVRCYGLGIGNGGSRNKRSPNSCAVVMETQCEHLTRAKSGKYIFGWRQLSFLYRYYRR
jgi:hypothetical protein